MSMKPEDSKKDDSVKPIQNPDAELMLKSKTLFSPQLRSATERPDFSFEPIELTESEELIKPFVVGVKYQSSLKYSFCLLGLRRKLRWKNGLR